MQGEHSVKQFTVAAIAAEENELAAPSSSYITGRKSILME
jgi:hypothetical protein